MGDASPVALFAYLFNIPFYAINTKIDTKKFGIVRNFAIARTYVGSVKKVYFYIKVLNML